MLKTLLYGDIYQTSTGSGGDCEPIFITGTLDCLISTPSLSVDLGGIPDLSADISQPNIDCDINTESLSLKLNVPNLTITVSEDCTC